MMEGQRIFLAGQTYDISDPRLQEVLDRTRKSAERPRCLCVPEGVDMYVAHHRQYLIKRMPGTGGKHHSACPSFEPDAQQSGLGELIGEAIIETAPDSIELRVDFPWQRVQGRSVARGEAQAAGEVKEARRRMSLRALTHFLFERAGLNRWMPGMVGKRNQGVVHKYLLDAAGEMIVKGCPLAQRLYVPEPFSESARAAIARRRREKLAVLQPTNGQVSAYTTWRRVQVQIVKTDEGMVNARILARESKADFRRVEAASIKMVVRLTSAGQRTEATKWPAFNG
jgi:hypothetical protein